MKKIGWRKRFFSVVMALILLLGSTLISYGTKAQAAGTSIEYQVTVNNFWGAAGNTQLVCGYTGSVPVGSVFTGKVLLNGTETNVNWVVSGQNFFLKKADGNVQITISECNSVGVYAGSKMTASDGTCITIQNDCFYEKNPSGNLVVTTPPSQKPTIPEPTDHTPTTGIEIPEGVTVLKQVDFSGSDYQHSSSVGAATKNNVLVVGENIYSRQLLYGNQLTTEKTYILSYYVWVAEEDGVYDMHFDDAGSPNGAGGNYTANVFAQWSNLHSTYIKNCTIDGVPTTASITDATNGWKKVEVEWTPKATGNVLIQLGDYGGQSQVTGTTYIDDFLVYEKPIVVEPVHLSTDLSFYKVMSNGQAAFTYANTEVASFTDGTKFTGSILFNETKTEIEWTKSGNCLMTPSITNYGDVTKIEVVSGTVLTSSTGDTITLNNDLDYIYSNGVWVENIPVTELETEVAFYRCNESLTAFAFGNEEIKNIPDGTVFSGMLTVDKVETALNWIKSGNCFVIQGLKDDGAFMRLEVPRGTRLVGSNATNITITNNLKFVKLEDSWMEDYGQTKIEYNDVKISFSNFDGRGYYLKAEIVAGPDKGKVIGTEAYGTWASRSEGVAFINGTKEMTINYSPNVDMLYVSGSWDLDAMTSILFKEGTVLIPYSGAQNKTYMRLANTLELEKEEAYGRWGEKGVIETPTEFHEVTVSVYNVTGVKVVLEPTLTSGLSKKISDIYGNGTLCYGSVIYGEPGQGVYTNENASFYVSGNQILLMNASIGLMDSIEMKAGTILWPSADSASQVPLRIQNSVVLTRNVDDEWIYSVENVVTDGGAFGSVNSPTTGDKAPFGIYIGVMFITLVGAYGGVYYGRKRRKVNV